VKNRFRVKDSKGNGFEKESTEVMQILHFYAVNTTLAVEPFSHIHLEHGEEISWGHTIRFFTGSNPLSDGNEDDDGRVSSILLIVCFKILGGMLMLILVSSAIGACFRGRCCLVLLHRGSRRNVGSSSTGGLNSNKWNKTSIRDFSRKADDSIAGKRTTHLTENDANGDLSIRFANEIKRSKSYGSLQ